MRFDKLTFNIVLVIIKKVTLVSKMSHLVDLIIVCFYVTYFIGIKLILAF